MNDAAILPRWGWIALLALSLIGLCSAGLAAETGLDAPPVEPILPGPIEPASPADYPSGPSVIVAGAVATVPAARPERIELSAELANYDRDAGPDGWKLTVLLLDTMNQPLSLRSQAAFELRPGRIASDGMTFIAGNRIAERWSMPLEADRDGVATVRLTPQHTLLPWAPAVNARWSAVHAQTRRLSTTRYPHRRHDRALPASPFPSHRPAVDRSHDFLATGRSGDVSGAAYPVEPQWGLLSVRVSVPTQGIFEAATVVPLSWPIKNLR